MDPVSIGSWIQLLSVLFGVAMTAYGAFQKFRAGKSEDAAKQLRATVDGMVTAVALLPDTDATRQAKAAIQVVSTSMGTEEQLNATVKTIKAALNTVGLGTSDDELGQTRRAAQVVRAMRAQEKATGTPSILKTLPEVKP